MSKEYVLRKAKSIILRIDDFREEKLEDFIANEILGKIDECKKIDELERQAILVGIKSANMYLVTYGVPTLPNEVEEQIANLSVKALGKGNRLLQKQLKKKSKRYRARKESLND